jgi:phage FluMu protein Com
MANPLLETRVNSGGFTAYEDCVRCSGKGFIRQESSDGHRTDYWREQCPRCRSIFEVLLELKATGLIGSNKMKVVGESVKVINGKAIITQTYEYIEFDPLPAMRSDDV